MVEFRVGERADWADVRAVLQAKRSFQREVSPVRQVRRAVLQAELSFQRDTTLCKRYNACKVWYRCKSGGIAVKTEPTTHDAPGFVGATRKTGTTGLDLPRATGPGEEMLPRARWRSACRKRLSYRGDGHLGASA